MKTRIKILAAVFCILITLTSISAKTTCLSDVLQEDVEAGKISRAQFLRYQLQAAENPDRLPEPYKNCRITFTQSLTVLAAEARMLLTRLAGEEKHALEMLLQRPSSDRLPLTLISPSGHFKIHYITSGMDSCSEAYAQEVVQTFDYLYQLEVEQLGFDPPPDDGGVDGPEFDIYIMNFYPYGETVYENPVPNSGGFAYTSFMKIDRNFTNPRYFTYGLDAMRVTAAHEFFHMIQGGYRFFPTTQLNSIFLFEASSVWMEEVAYPEVNDYLQYVNSFMQSPNHAFNNTNYCYALGLYTHMITKQYGNQVVNRIWEAFRSMEPLDAIDFALRSYNERFDRSLVDFTMWNCFTADWADTVQYYHEGHLYPKLNPKNSYELETSLTITGSCSELVSHYYRITVLQDGRYAIVPELQNPAHWMYAMVIHSADGLSETVSLAGDASPGMLDIKAGSELWIMPTNVLWPETDNSNHPFRYSFDIQQGGSIPNPHAGIIAMKPAPFIPEVHDEMEIEYRFTREQSSACLYIFNENGAPVFTRDLCAVSKGLKSYSWDGINDQGQPVASGIYICIIRGDDILKPKKFALMR
ncbi:hypothetical protein JXO59_03620 [candidate division KSB1 bacterium]|nr:hypothetical protein [candidate division KSB1 bacterium]